MTASGIGLTACQADLLRFIEHQIALNGEAPSFEQMRRNMGLRAKSGIHRLLTGLEERGRIRRLKHCARAIEVVAPEVLPLPPRVAWLRLCGRINLNEFPTWGRS